ncbi:MAG TPA: dTDP-4-dehydrorhamnose 3,5-epimerase family protein [Candidatus Manganitrophaceae bacterium]
MFKKGNISGVDHRPLKKYRDERGWLSELFREDEIAPSILPVMSYLSLSLPGVTRGPHEHVEQTDYFCFIGPSNFKITLWDNREKSPTYRNKMEFVVGEDSPAVVIVPEGVVHAYQNVGGKDGVVINCPNRLFMGKGKKEKIDEIRHEEDPKSVFVIDLQRRE